MWCEKHGGLLNHCDECVAELRAELAEMREELEQVVNEAVAGGGISESTPNAAGGSVSKEPRPHEMVADLRAQLEAKNKILTGLGFRNWKGLKARVAGLESALTPSAETKDAYRGEFDVIAVKIDKDGNETIRAIPVPWTTIKEIMMAIRTLAAAKEE